ncbi:MAG: aminoglycoside phosphotransferase family protein [Planctomycetota bacterium]|nr:aminoglycoside phosphotransferase family protein [Planctomycetota bacterium]
MNLPESTFSGIPEVVRSKFLRYYGARVVWRATGGFSQSRVFRCEAEEQDYCLRSWPKQSYALERLEQVRRAIGQTHAAGLICLPKYFSAAEREFFLDAGDSYWELGEWLPGRAEYLENRSPEKLSAAMDTLAALHQVWNATSGQDFSPAWRRRITGLEGAAQHQLTQKLLRESHKCTERSAGSGELAMLGMKTVNLMREYASSLYSLLNSAPARTNLHFVLRDIWSDHVLFSGDSVSGVIDFGAAGIDEPATDLARLLGSMEPADADQWWRGLCEYRKHSPSLCPHRVLILDQASCLLSAIQWAKWLILEGREFSADRKVITDRWASFLFRLETFPWDELRREVGPADV